MKLPVFLQSVKNNILEKNQLATKRQEILSAIKRGEDFFKVRTEPSEILKGVKQLSGYLNQLREVESKIHDIDVSIIVSLELFLGDFYVKFNIPEHTNDAGDLISKEDIIFTLDKTNLEYTEIYPDDIWILKIIKQAFSPENVEFIQKGGAENEKVL